MEIEKLFTSGSEVAAFYVLHLDHRVGQIRVAERFFVEGDRIASSILLMDTAPFLARHAAAPPDTAIDPVSHVEVDKATPAATRTHQGVSYYFCSTGCTEAFLKAPEQYLAG